MKKKGIFRLTDVVKVTGTMFGDLEALGNLSRIANGLWNCCIYENKRRYEQEKKFVFYTELCNRFSDQKLHQWLYGEMTRQLKYKCDMYGLPFGMENEAWTSKTCCICGKRHPGGRVKRGLYICSKHHKAFNADGNGSVGISKTYLRVPLGTPSGIGVVAALARPVVMLWNNHSWVEATA